MKSLPERQAHSRVDDKVLSPKQYADELAPPITEFQRSSEKLVIFRQCSRLETEGVDRPHATEETVGVARSIRVNFEESSVDRSVEGADSAYNNYNCRDDANEDQSEFPLTDERDGEGCGKRGDGLDEEAEFF